MDKNLADLEYEKGRREKGILTSQATIDNLNLDLRNKSENLGMLEGQIADANKTMLTLQNEIRDLDKANEKSKTR